MYPKQKSMSIARRPGPGRAIPAAGDLCFHEAMTQRYYSNVYWHFTGSPTNLEGALVTRPADIHRAGRLKSVDEALDTLLRILTSRKLLATSVERISARIQTDPFCCVTDIPLKDLPVHAQSYGKVALGFKASAIHPCFVPVMYLSKDNEMMRNLLIEGGQGDGAGASGRGNPFWNFVKITDFGMRPDESFYSEREWRHVGEFAFESDAIEAVIAPADKLPDLRTRLVESLGYPATLSLIGWEFLENA